MNSKEISEIKKQFKDSNCAITRFCGCYVNEEKIKVAEFKETFLALPEEESNKYFKIFRKTLSGNIGKNLLNMEFSTEDELSNTSGHHMLMELLQSGLDDEEILSGFYDKVIDNYDTLDHFLILLIHQAYDIPKKGSDNIEMEDASSDVYTHILCCICPVTLSKEGLSYSVMDNCFKNRIRDWVVEMPKNGFLFPAFNDRSTDIHSLLYYAAKPEELKPDFINSVLGCKDIPLSSVAQKETFHSVVEETLRDEITFDVVKNINTIINEKIDESKMAEEPMPLSFDRDEVKQILSDSGVTDETLERFDETYASIVGNKNDLFAANIAETRKFEVKTPDVIVKVNADKTDLVTTKEIDGEKFLLVKLTDSVEVNGILMDV